MILVLGVVAQETNIRKYFQIEIINKRKLRKILSLKKYCCCLKLYMHKMKRRKQVYREKGDSDKWRREEGWSVEKWGVPMAWLKKCNYASQVI
jgi:hypothetical protein